MTAPEKLTGENAELTIDGIVVAHADFSMPFKRGVISQERVGSHSPRTAPGTVGASFKFTNLDINGDHLAKLLTNTGGAATRTVLDSCDTSANWAVSGTNAANSVISLDTTNKKKGTGCVLITNTGDASGNVVVATLSPAVDLSGFHLLEIWLRSSVAGADIADAGFGESAITENTKAVTMQKADTWQRVTYDISAIPDASKNAVTKVGITLGSDCSGNAVYIDSVNALKGFKFGTTTKFDLTARCADPDDDTKYVDIFAPNCYFTDFELSWTGGATKFIDGPVSGGIEDADDVQLFFS